MRIDAVENYIRGLLAAAPEQRMRFFSAAARLDEHYSPPAFQLAKIYWEKKDYKTSATWFARVARSDPRYLEAQFFLGLCRFYIGDYAAAEHCFALVAEQVPLNEVWNNLGAAQARQKKTEAAAVSFAKAIEGDSADPDYRFNLGFTQWRAAQYPAASGEPARRHRAQPERSGGHGAAGPRAQARWPPRRRPAQRKSRAGQDELRGRGLPAVAGGVEEVRQASGLSKSDLARRLTVNHSPVLPTRVVIHRPTSRAPRD